MAFVFVGLLATASFASAQLSGTVGPTTSTASKASTKICNIMDYGGVSDASTDNSDAISSAWDACKSGGEVYIPEGDYGLESWVTLTGGESCSINLEGTIYRTGTAGGNMFMIEHSSDFEFYSATSKGAIQGYGYEFHKDGEYGPRILRFYDVTDFSLHDVALVDSPAFHVSFDTTTNGEVYNMIIRGGNEGGLDGVDVWGTNMWIHDVEVTNKDECVTVKDPSDHILVEQVHCNWSGGCAMGSLASGIDIHDIEYDHVYTHHSNQMYMIKSNGGSGDVYNVALNNFVGHTNAYSLDFDSTWSSMDVVDGDGIQYSNISFNGWTGTCDDGVERGPIKMNCPEATPCTDITISDFNMWTEEGDEILYACYNAYGSGACLNDGTDYTAYTTTMTLTTASDYSYSTMANELTSGFDLSSSIPIPTMPASFFPGLSPISAILDGAASQSSSAAVAVTTDATESSSSVAAVYSSSAPSASDAAAPTSVSSGGPKLTATVSASQSMPTFGSWPTVGAGQSGFGGSHNHASSSAAAYGSQSTFSLSYVASPSGITSTSTAPVPLVTAAPSAATTSTRRGKCGHRRPSSLRLA